MKKTISCICICFLLSALPLSACSTKKADTTSSDNVLRIASWDEYIDMGGEVYEGDDPDLLDFKAWYKDLTGVDLDNTRPLYEEFEDWYEEVYGEEITVEYIALQDNETMYNKIKMGDSYDLLCPSEYMAMKLQAENKLIAFDKEFFDPTIETNYYAQNVSPYTQEIFNGVGLSEYIAGYMWGTTGFVYNPSNVNDDVVKSWHCLTSEACARTITAKDNVRDSYFMGLGMLYEEELLALDSNSADYKRILNEKMNDTSEPTMLKVKKLLEKARDNLYGLETDEAKMDIIMGELSASYQWSGDAVFVMDEAERNDLELRYSIPQSASNLWFDGWVMMEGANQKAAKAFINFLSMPRNAIRNMYYIGYTSCLGGEAIYDYVDYTYGDEEGVEYDLSYFFGEGYAPLTVPEEQLSRQLFAQYPDSATKNRLVVMKYFNKEENERANRMWNTIK